MTDVSSEQPCRHHFIAVEHTDKPGVWVIQCEYCKLYVAQPWSDN